MSPGEIIEEPKSFITSSIISESLRRHVSQHADLLVADAVEARFGMVLMRNAADEIDRLRDAIFWCGGSPSFSEGGEAYEGWQRMCLPLLNPDR